MSSAKENTCRKFQANIFNKSKCQNCFKPRELHLLTDQDLNQAKPIYGGWLCLAPEGTDFDNPMQRSRKWQRRFFVLYEHGCLRFALDESPSTLPQGTVNMNLCTDVIDAEPRTGQKNALCIITPEQEYYIRGDNKEIINGWTEQLVVYPRTNKQNQKKKRKVEPATSQEPGPAKVAVTGSGIPEAEKTPDSSSIIWQEELQSREADVSQTWTASDMPPLGSPLPSAGEGSMASRCSDQSSVNGDEVERSGLSFHSAVSQPSHDPLSPTGSSSSRHSAEMGGVPRCLSPAPSDPFPSGSSLLSNGSHISGSMSSLDSDASGSTVTSTDSHPAEPMGRPHRALPRRSDAADPRKPEKRSRLRSPERQDKESVFSPERSGRSNVIEKLEALELEHAEQMEVEETSRGGVRQGRSEMRRFQREEQKMDPAQGLDFHHSTLPPLRRAKSLDRRTTESVMTPDLLNFKKGWMVKLDEQGQWKKYWFVLTDHSLRYYKDSIAEEASDLDGEIDLSTCYNVTEYQAQRNYGFQIHTQEAVHTLSAMTAGIRRNWIQAVMKNVRPSTAPDVASLTDEHGSCGPFESLARPDITQDSPSSEASVEREGGIKKSRARERRREGRSKTFDWAEFRPIAQALAQQRAHEADTFQAELTERNKRREERRRRYESVTGSSFDPPAADTAKMDFESGGVVQVDAPPPSVERQQRVEDEIEQRWQQVEKTPIREERRVPLPSTHQSRDTSELEKLVESYKKGVEELKAQLESCHQQLMDSNRHKLELEGQLKNALEREQQIRAGYISPLESPLSLETEPQMKRTELVSSQAQSLTKKYQETKELLQLQELKKRNMQAQLGLSLSHWPTKEPCLSDTKKTATSEVCPSNSIQKTVSFTLQDSEGKIRELEGLIDASEPLTLRELIKLMHSHSEYIWVESLQGQEGSEYSRSVGEMMQCQKLLESLKNQQEIENETMRKSLERAGDCIRDYEARLVNMEDMLGRVQMQKMENPYASGCYREDHPEMTSRDLSQQVELLANENVALNQRYQEIVNQLREADREIDRLKAELCRLHSSQKYTQANVNREQEDNGTAYKNVYERELSEKSQKLQEALVKLETLGNNLKDTEKRLQLKEATLRGLGFQVAESEGDKEFDLEKDELKRQLEVLQSELSEKEKKLQNAEQVCRELQHQNTELLTKHEETARMFSQMLVDSRTLKPKAGTQATFGSEPETESGGCQELMQREESVTNEDVIEKVVEEFKRKSKSLNHVLDMLVIGSKATTEWDLSSTNILDENQTGLMFERRILREVLGGLEDGQKERTLEDARNVIERMLVDNKMLLLMNNISNLQERATPATCTDESTGKWSEETMKSNILNRWFDHATNPCVMKSLAEVVEKKVALLNQTASVLRERTNEQLQSLALALSSCDTQRCWSEYIREAIMDVTSMYFVVLQIFPEMKRLDLSACANCASLRAQLQSELEEKQVASSDVHSGDLTAVTHIQIEGEPIDSLDKAIQLQDSMAKHKKELRELKEVYEQEAEKLRQEVAKAAENLKLRSEENVKEIDSLTVCMENLKKKHEMECNNLQARFNREMEELTDVVGPVEEEPGGDGEPNSTSLKVRIQKLVSRVSELTEEMNRQERDGDATLLRLKYEKDLENLKATCERGFAAMEESHQKVIDELQKKHQRELEKLQEEKERLLAEETAATISAIEAMKNAHRTELEKELEKARKANNNTENADIEEIRKQHEEELMSYQREIEVLSEQYSQKCLENAHLAQALEAERQALRQCQRENQELNAHNQELNNRLAAEITKMRSMASEDGGDAGGVMQGKELYELEVMLRVKESEVQYLKQEINSLKDELQTAQRDKKYATDKYKDIYTELSIVRAKAERDLGRLREQLQQAHDALGDPTLEDVERGGYDIMKSKSNPDILKIAAAAAKRSERTMRSKSVSRDMSWDS
ncbi:myosin phosphatase Rho-interacting protein isoform X2 [Ctenopharyngodon idella]|uniref:myosin phosphatase Rho-interacting protein isoform X2 n=1 Tax=Ctenopharyngodon idella TaxID=7959 RepID=UPI0022329F75|nr:myosin phosphatase Rho-interacting protein isoform X2 [Ctenopharyngodon idella]